MEGNFAESALSFPLGQQHGANSTLIPCTPRYLQTRSPPGVLGANATLKYGLI